MLDRLTNISFFPSFYWINALCFIKLGRFYFFPQIWCSFWISSGVILEIFPHFTDSDSAYKDYREFYVFFKLYFLKWSVSVVFFLDLSSYKLVLSIFLRIVFAILIVYFYYFSEIDALSIEITELAWMDFLGSPLIFRCMRFMMSSLLGQIFVFFLENINYWLT